MMEKEATQYFEEVAHCLDRAGIQTGEASGGFLPVLWGDQLLCEVNRKGIMYWNEVENSEEIEQIKKSIQHRQYGVRVCGTHGTSAPD